MLGFIFSPSLVAFERIGRRWSRLPPRLTKQRGLLRDTIKTSLDCHSGFGRRSYTETCNYLRLDSGVRLPLLFMVHFYCTTGWSRSHRRALIHVEIIPTFPLTLVSGESPPPPYTMNTMEDYSSYEELFIDDISEAVDEEILNRLHEAKTTVRMAVWCAKHPYQFLKILWRVL